LEIAVATSSVNEPRRVSVSGASSCSLTEAAHQRAGNGKHPRCCPAGRRPLPQPRADQAARQAHNLGLADGYETRPISDGPAPASQLPVGVVPEWGVVLLQRLVGVDGSGW
jgi:hypothetical protein